MNPSTTEHPAYALGTTEPDAEIHLNQRLPSGNRGDEEEGVSKRSADALSAVHGRDGLVKTRE